MGNRDLVDTFHLAILADCWWLIRTFSRRMSFFVAYTTRALEYARLGTF